MSFGGSFQAIVTVPEGVTLSATSNAGGPTTCTVTAGDYTIEELCVQLEDDLDSQRPVSGGGWSFSPDVAAGGNGKVTISVDAGTYSITWLDTDLRDLLGFVSNVTTQASVTGGKQARGLWLPNCPLFTDLYYKSVTMETDLRQTESPDGIVITHTGNFKFRHTNLKYTHVADSRTWILAETVTNESLEQFVVDTQWGYGHAWFLPGTKVQITSHDGSATELGSALITGWYLKGIQKMQDIVKRVGDTWDGQWTVIFPELVTDDS